eukprot:m.325742 g.325742  ORF g.325742 m.325742 type:complete len:143 (+) comp55564_c2_seq21:536-964(+)
MLGDDRPVKSFHHSSPRSKRRTMGQNRSLKMRKDRRDKSPASQVLFGEVGLGENSTINGERRAPATRQALVKCLASVVLLSWVQQLLVQQQQQQQKAPINVKGKGGAEPVKEAATQSDEVVAMQIAKLCARGSDKLACLSLF